MNIVLASRNKKKLEELKKIIEEGLPQGKALSVNILTPEDFPQCKEIEEDGATFEANAIKKAKYIFQCSGITAIADDSGLEVDALNGAPGVLSARYAGASADDEANIKKLLTEMKDIPPEKRSARFVCCIALASKNEVKTFFGYVEGTIGTEPRGDKGFGYDPVFFPKGSNRTFAEMSEKEKNTISHRAQALKKLQSYLKEKGFNL
jgi:XTP/dITP diphosphohydrolase